MPYELYRRSTLGLTLADALDDMIQSEQLTPHLAMRVLSQFDRSMMENLDRKIRSRCVLKVMSPLMSLSHSFLSFLRY